MKKTSTLPLLAVLFGVAACAHQNADIASTAAPAPAQTTARQTPFSEMEAKWEKGNIKISSVYKACTADNHLLMWPEVAMLQVIAPHATKQTAADVGSAYQLTLGANMMQLMQDTLSPLTAEDIINQRFPALSPEQEKAQTMRNERAGIRFQTDLAKMRILLRRAGGPGLGPWALSQEPSPECTP